LATKDISTNGYPAEQRWLKLLNFLCYRSGVENRGNGLTSEFGSISASDWIDVRTRMTVPHKGPNNVNQMAWMAEMECINCISEDLMLPDSSEVKLQAFGPISKLNESKRLGIACSLLRFHLIKLITRAQPTRLLIQAQKIKSRKWARSTGSLRRRLSLKNSGLVEVWTGNGAGAYWNAEALQILGWRRLRWFCWHTMDSSGRSACQPEEMTTAVRSN